MFDNDIAFNSFKVVFGRKVQKYDKLTNVLTHEFRFKSFKEIQDGKFKTDVLYCIVMWFNYLCVFSDYNVLIDVIFLRNHWASSWDSQDNANWDWKETVYEHCVEI